ncbi:hypothetical protein (doubtful CDS) [Clavibacter sepedonicus]|uniref:Uncharacterized protein n=1 Tax=Clavibacter sepedonicus TaxID=31964 RepID=B0RGF4_CLASE|nr:hypothetical protein (doubtful CDS) [Clavibacter sepedonicus]
MVAGIACEEIVVPPTRGTTTSCEKRKKATTMLDDVKARVRREL